MGGELAKIIVGLIALTMGAACVGVVFGGIYLIACMPPLLSILLAVITVGYVIGSAILD